MQRIDVGLFGSPAFSVGIEADGRFRYTGVNDVLCRQSGLVASEIVGYTPTECLPPAVAAHVETQYRHCIELHAVYDYEEHIELAGEAKWWRTTLSPIIDPVTKNVVGVFGLSMDVTDRKRDEIELRSAAFKDPLTGICNRRRFERDLDLAMAGAVEGGRPFALVLADVDRFKPINDTYGHAAGDMVLQELALRLAKGIRTGDRLARIGGDEFAGIFQVDSEEATAEVLRRLHHEVEGPILVGEKTLGVGMSLGAVLWRPGMTKAGMLATADAAMYREKRSVAA